MLFPYYIYSSLDKTDNFNVEDYYYSDEELLPNVSQDIVYDESVDVNVSQCFGDIRCLSIFMMQCDNIFCLPRSRKPFIDSCHKIVGFYLLLLTICFGIVGNVLAISG